MHVQVHITKKAYTEKMGLYIHVFIIIIQMKMLMYQFSMQNDSAMNTRYIKKASFSTKNKICSTYFYAKIFMPIVSVILKFENNFFLPRER